MIGERLGAALFAAPRLAAKRGGTAIEDVFGGAPVRGRHRRTVGREVVRREAAEHQGGLDHDRASQAGHQPVKQTARRRPGWQGRLKVPSGAA
jgi:hypothetical protein